MRRRAVVPACLSALLACTLALASLPARADAADDAAWLAVQEGRAVILMRHALAPGGGDPAAFDRNDCSTQRNLSEQGREQARQIGVALRARLTDTSPEVFSSAWCRCRDTGELLGFGEVGALAPLDSFFRDRAAQPAQTEALRSWIAARLQAGDAQPAVLVTHQVNITALTGVYPASGQVVVVDADLEVLASLELVKL